MAGVVEGDLVGSARAALDAVDEETAADVVGVAQQVVVHRHGRRGGSALDGHGHAEAEGSIEGKVHFLHGLFNGVQALMVGRGVQRRLGHAADGRNVRADLGCRQQAAVAGLGALAYLDQHGAGIRLHVRHGADDAVPAEVAGGDLNDHVLELFALQQAYGHAAFAGAHAHGKVALLVQVGHGQRQRFPRSRGKGADGHIGENQRVDPAHGRGMAAQDEVVAVEAEREGIHGQNAAERSAHVKRVALGVQRGVRHLGNTAHDDGIKRTDGMHVLAAAALDGSLAAREQRRAGVGVAHGMNGLVGADLLAHAAARAGVGRAVLLTDDSPGVMFRHGRGAAFAGYDAISALHSHFYGIKRAGSHTGAAQRAFFRIVFNLPVQVVECNVLRAHCFHLRTSSSLSISMSSRSFG